MEIKGLRYNRIHWAAIAFFIGILLCSMAVMAQPPKAYTVKNGRMYVQLPKNIAAASLDSFIHDFDLYDLGLSSFIKTGKPDSLVKMGWKVEVNNETGLVISKPFEPFEGLSKIDDKIFFKDRPNPLFPAVNNGIIFGANQFRNKSPFYTQDSIVRFFLRGHKNADRVMLAGSFNNWVPDQLSMLKTDSGWIYQVALGVGKWWYKFIVDGNWISDPDNNLSENDGLGNINSVFYKTNIGFALPGYQNAKKVFLAGSFNNWEEKQLSLKKTGSGWELPLYLAQGTHTYKFIVDGKWITDENNREVLPDGHGAYNSVIRLGKPHLFKLDGFQNAAEVMLAGSFNQWREFELKMNKTATGWELPYVIGAGNYEYKFKVDGKWIADPGNPVSSPVSGNSFLILEPNYTFRLKGFKNAKKGFPGRRFQ